jgi:4-amino-4-deoxy-L-arabinose transferase-like glycosyltransferase
MTEPTSPERAGERRAMLAVLGLALAVRVAAALAVEWVARRRGELCLFDDANIYWHLAGAIRSGAAYVVWQYDQPHYALRAPTYPLWLATVRAAFGPSTLAVRLAQAALGTAGVWMLMRLTGRHWPESSGRGWRSAPVLAGLVAAIEPYSAASSALILSEAVFVPLLLLTLWGLAALWTRPGEPIPRHWGWIALAAGVSAGLAVLARPSWALYVPAALAAWIALAGRGRRLAALRGSALVTLGLVVAMGPWWARNSRVFGRYVPTALWLGASLYDGLRPGADGSSDMAFLDRPEILRLDETTQDRVLRDRAIAFARTHPGRVLELAAIKAARYWSPWPNADQFSSTPGNLASAAVTIPLYALIGLGLWGRRRDPRAWVLLVGPLSYFAAVHMIFVSSIRYRIPAIVPAFALAGAGVARAVGGGRWAVGGEERARRRHS